MKETFLQDPWPWAKPAHGNPTAMVINATLFMASLSSFCWCATRAKPSCKSVGKGAQWYMLRNLTSQGIAEWIKVESGLRGANGIIQQTAEGQTLLSVSSFSRCLILHILGLLQFKGP